MTMDEAALVAAVEQAPEDASAIIAYAEYLRAVGDPRGELAGSNAKPKTGLKALLGPLAGFGASLKLEKWRSGFVDHVRMIADDEKHALQMLDAMLASATTRFVRTLELVIIGKRRSYAEIDARLAEQRRPRTLTTLVLGKPGDHTLSPALLAAFPRLAGAPRSSWDEVATAIRTLRGAGPGFATEPLALPSKIPLPLTTGELVRGLAAEIGRKQPIGLVARLVDEWSGDQLAAVSAALVAAWTLHGEDASDAWVYDAAVRFGGAESARLIGRRLAGLSHARAEHAIDSLARMSCPLATLELFEASRHWSARGQLAETALARRVPDLLATLAQLGSDPRCEGEALARFRELDAHAIEQLMVSGWTAPLATVRGWFASERGAGLVWRTDPIHPTTPLTLFTLDRDRTLSHDGTAIAVAPESRVSLVHVAASDLPDLSAWRAWQQARVACVDQLSRTAPAHATVADLDRLVFDHGIDVDALRVRGYRNGGVKTDDTHEETLFVKTHRHRGHAYSVSISEVSTQRVRISPPPPLIVLFETARDLATRSS